MNINIAAGIRGLSRTSRGLCGGAHGMQSIVFRGARDGHKLEVFQDARWGASIGAYCLRAPWALVMRVTLVYVGGLKTGSADPKYAESKKQFEF